MYLSRYKTTQQESLYKTQNETYKSVYYLSEVPSGISSCISTSFTSISISSCSSKLEYLFSRGDTGRGRGRGRLILSMSVSCTHSKCICFFQKSVAPLFSLQSVKIYTRRLIDLRRFYRSVTLFLSMKKWKNMNTRNNKVAVVGIIGKSKDGKAHIINEVLDYPVFKVWMCVCFARACVCVLPVWGCVCCVDVLRVCGVCYVCMFSLERVHICASISILTDIIQPLYAHEKKVASLTQFDKDNGFSLVWI